MMEMLAHDTGLWVAISFLLFAIVAFKLGRKSVTGGLDSKIAEIRKEIQTAETLRVEAHELLAQYQRKQRDAEKEAAEIVARAKEHSEEIRKQAEANLSDTMERREAQLTERLKRIEQNAIAEIQNHAAEVAVAATTEIINQTLDEKANERLTAQSIENVSKHLN